MAKQRIIEALGERRLLLPGLVAEALAANDRVKYRLTLLQSARAAADGAPAPSLHEERIASGVEDAALDRVVGASERGADGGYRIPGAAALAQSALGDVRAMLAPLEAAEIGAASTLAARV